MRKTTLILSLVFAACSLFAQQIAISEAPRAKENGTYNSYLFELPDVSQETATKDWTKFMSSFKGKTKYVRKTKLHFTDNAKMARLSDGTVDVYARILQDKNPEKRTSVIVWFDLGDNYVSSESDRSKSNYVYDILTEYAVMVSKNHAEMILGEEEDVLKKLEKELSKLEKDNKTYRKEIEQAKESITKNEKNIEVNELDQKNKRKAIETQKSVVGEAKAGVAKFN